MANPTDPFAAFDPRNFMDLGKLGPDAMRLPAGFDMSALVEAQRRNVEAMTRANQVAAEGVQALAQRHGEMLRQGLEQAGQALRALMAAGSPEDKAARQTDLAREALERATANARELVEIAARAQHEAGDVLARRLAASLNELKAAIEAGQKR